MSPIQYVQVIFQWVSVDSFMLDFHCAQKKKNVGDHFTEHCAQNQTVPGNYVNVNLHILRFIIDWNMRGYPLMEHDNYFCFSCQATQRIPYGDSECTLLCQAAWLQPLQYVQGTSQEVQSPVFTRLIWTNPPGQLCSEYHVVQFWDTYFANENQTKLITFCSPPPPPLPPKN